VPDVVDDMYKGIRNNTPTKFMEKGLNNPVVKWVTKQATSFKKWISGKKGLTFFRDTTPSQE